MADHRRSHTAEFKRAAVERVKHGESVTQVAASAKIHQSLLRTWVQKARKGQGQGAKRPASNETDAGKLARLHRELRVSMAVTRELISQILIITARDLVHEIDTELGLHVAGT